MKIGLITYPMLWQRMGGLQIQITKTLESLTNSRHDVQLFDVLQDRLQHFDLIHIFSVQNGNHRIVEEARAQGVTTILSPMVHEDSDPLVTYRYAASSWLTAHISRYELKTTYDDFRRGIDLSHHLLALSAGEKNTLMRLYGQDGNKITVATNGISSHFFDADPTLFQTTHGFREPFILIVGSVSPYKNQLGVIRATAGTSTPIVLIGPADNTDYLQQCLTEGGARVNYMGIILHDDPLLASAYAAAGVTVLASNGESFGLTIAESLAAGTPAIITRANGLALPEAPPCLTFVTPEDHPAIARAIADALTKNPGADACRLLVTDLSWKNVAKTIEGTYDQIIQRPS